ncbi:MAG: virulence-associated E family protein [Oscillospiraceae bacterium]|nr:virulence-associated E family protein [Oscillospiraceae bacterium]
MKLTIATGDSRKCINWKNEETTWDALIKRLSEPTRTQESVAEYKALPKSRRDEIKDVGGFVGGQLRGGRRKADAVISRSLLTLDLDSVPSGEDPWFDVGMLDCAAAMYSTHSHTVEAPRLRVVIPLSRPVTPDEYGAISRWAAKEIGIDRCDDTTYEPHRLMYWGSVPRDGEYRFEVQDGEPLDVDAVLATYNDWRDTAQWPTSGRREVIRKLASKQGNPLEKPGLIGAFCRAHTVSAAIDTFLPGVYVPCGDGRYTYAEGSTVGGLVVYDGDTFAYSHHATDPCGERLVNAFDMVRLHKFGDKDERAKPDTPVNKLPSFMAMCEFAGKDKAVSLELLKEALDDDGEAATWGDLLNYDSKGNVAPTANNIVVILTHDARVAGKFYFDEFRLRPIICGDLPWSPLALRATDVWTDTDDAALRVWLEEKYHLTNKTKIADALKLAMFESKRHPLREELERLGKAHSNTGDVEEALFMLGAPDTPYVRAVTKCFFVGLVARIFEPGCKHDHMLVLYGPQGCGKSSWAEWVASKRWFSDSLYSMAGKDAYEQLWSKWLLEVGEMAAMTKYEVGQVKAFVSKMVDSFRAAYAVRSEDHPRQCAFIGTTNEREFMRDQTGGRRFWAVEVGMRGIETLHLRTAEYREQLLSEAVRLYWAGEKWHLSAEMEDEARAVQEAHTEKLSMHDTIVEWLERPLPADWASRTIDQRLEFWRPMADFGKPETGTLERTTVCPREVWLECFGGSVQRFAESQKISRDITAVLNTMPNWERDKVQKRHPQYGLQRLHRRNT